MPGLFIQRQVEAVSAHCDVSVLYVHEDSQCINNYEIDIAEENKIQVVRIYYRSFSSDLVLLVNLSDFTVFSKPIGLVFGNFAIFHPISCMFMY